MVKIILAKPDQLQSDHIAIGGKTLGFDEIMNEEFFVSSKISELRQTFKNNKPFPHLVFEGLFSPELLELMHEDFDHLTKDHVRVSYTMTEKKISTRPFPRLGHASELYFNTINSSRFISFLREITGIEGIITDPSLSRGGLHQIPTGGKFAMHVDFNRHLETKLDNRLVFITYLNKDWLPAYGGALELWDADKEKCEVEVLPVFGRSILFSQSSASLHGHPTPVAAPNRRPRRSAAAYYYSNGRPEIESTESHTTIIFKRRKTVRHERLAMSIKYITPPIVVEGIQRLMVWWRT